MRLLSLALEATVDKVTPLRDSRYSELESDMAARFICVFEGFDKLLKSHKSREKRKMALVLAKNLFV